MLTLRQKSDCRWDLVSLGEILLRLDPGDERIHTARQFRVWEGGGEYNVARNLASCFRLQTSVVTALANNQIGRLVEGLVSQGRVDTSRIVWRDTDGMSRETRNGIYFMERGFGLRPPTGCSDRGNTAVSKLKPGDIDWNDIFAVQGARWFHTGGIFAALSETTAEVTAEAMQAARANGVIASYDLNYRASLWSSRDGRSAADALNRELLKNADVVFGVEGFDASLTLYSDNSFRAAVEAMMAAYPGLKVVATTLRDVRSSSSHRLSGVCFDGVEIAKAGDRVVEVLDRVGSGDAFAAGLIHGLLSNQSAQRAVDIATASAALALTCIGDSLSVTLNEIETAASGTNELTIR